MNNLKTSVTVLVLALAVLLASPGLAAAETNPNEHGPMPIMVIGVILGPTMWAISTPFSLLFAPDHMMDGYEALVTNPWKLMIGEPVEDDRRWAPRY